MFLEHSQTGFVIVDVYSKVCGPCRILKFIFQDLEKEFQDLKILKVNYDRNQALVEHFKVHSYPTTLFFKDGQEVMRVEGLQQKPVLRQYILEMK